MMFRTIELNDRDWDESLEDYPYVGRTMGCGCCAEYVGLTPANLDEHIQALEEALEKARDIRSQL